MTSTANAIDANISSEPLLILDSRFPEVAAALSRRAEIFATVNERRGGARPRFAVVDGNALIPVCGPILNIGDIDLSDFGYTSYGFLAASFVKAAADPAITRAILQFNTPGGVVSGIESAAEALRALKAAKPVIAHVEGYAASAGYWLAAQADQILMTELSEVGSIGVYTSHVDMSGALEKAGLKVSLFSSGEHKTDAHPFAALPAGVRASLQADVDDLRQAFADDVALGRGDRLSADQALATEAKMYRGRTRRSGHNAIAAGLADGISSLAAILSSSPTRGTRSMSNTQTVTKADHDVAVAAARQEGAAEERTRIAAIMTSPEAKGREASALGLALAAGITADTAKVVLAGLPKVAAQSLPAGRSQDFAGGLAVVDATSGVGREAPAANDFERGKQIAKAMRGGAQ